jgi:outer membrane lipase/esterase
MSLKAKTLTKRALPALVASALMAAAGSANALQFQGVYVFGDSLSDSGFFRPFLNSIGVPPATTAQLGRFTTNPGPVWAELIAQTYGGNPNPSNTVGGQNFAQGGARIATASTSTPPGSAQRPVSTQITEFLAANNGAANPNGLYAVWIGANDIFQTLPAINAGQVNPTTFLAQAAGSTVQQVGRLQAAGARHILVFNLPDIGTTPGFTLPALGGSPALAAAGTQLSAGYNINLFNAVAASGLRVIPVDTFTLIAEVRANFAAFGFTNVTNPACGPFPPFAPAGVNSQFCLGNTLVPGATPTNYLFADGVHPTSGAHAILADHIKSLIDGPNAYSTLAEVPLSSRSAHIRTLDSGLAQSTGNAVGKLSAFAAFDGGKFDMNATATGPKSETDNRAATVGLTMRVSDAVTFGVGLGKNTNDSTLAGFGTYKLDETAFSVFGNAKSGGFYANFSASVSDLKFKDINRAVRLGPVTRIQRASTDGSNASGSLMVGYDFSFGGVSVGPFLGITQQKVSVNGFQENNGAAVATTSDLKIGAQERTSRVSSAGLRGSFNVGSFTPFARVSFDQEDNNQDRLISASPVTVTQNIFYDLPGYKGDKRWVTGTIGIRGKITDMIGLGVAYTSVSSKAGIKQDGVTANVNVNF